MIAEYLSLLALATSALANRNTSGIRGKLNLTYLFTANITTSSTISIGTTPFGERVFDPITGGSFSGPRLEGETLIVKRCFLQEKIGQEEGGGVGEDAKVDLH